MSAAASRVVRRDPRARGRAAHIPGPSGSPESSSVDVRGDPSDPARTADARVVPVLLALLDAVSDEEVVRRCAVAVTSLGDLRTEVAFTCSGDERRYVAPNARVPARLDHQIDRLGRAGGPITIKGRSWAWLVPLVGRTGWRGGIVVSGARRPLRSALKLMDTLALQAASALDICFLSQQSEEYADALADAKAEVARERQRLQKSTTDLEYRTRAHEVFNVASIQHDVVPAVASALHQLTALPVLVENSLGHVIGRAPPVGQTNADRHKPRWRVDEGETSRHLPIGAHRREDEVVVVVRSGYDPLGVVRLVDPTGQAGEHDYFAMEYAASIIAIELTHRRGMAELEQRLGNKLVFDLITGANSDNTVTRATALGHDINSPHCVVVAHWRDLADDDLRHAAGNIGPRMGLDVLAAPHGGKLVMLVAGPFEPSRLFDELGSEVRSRTGTIGIGGTTGDVMDLPRSFHEAKRALDVRARSRMPYGAAEYRDLGLYQVLTIDESNGAAESYIRQWLGDLIDYDRAHKTSLVETLAAYLDGGGRYESTTQVLVIHRSTLRYRLRRIREVAGLDLNHVETRLNAHIATRIWKVLGDQS